MKELKQIVNTKPVWDSFFLEYLDETITLVHKRLEQEADVEKNIQSARRNSCT